MNSETYGPPSRSFWAWLWWSLTWPIYWLLRQRPAFAVTAVLLLVAAVSLNSTVAWLHLHLSKQRVEPRKRLTELPAIIGTWVQLAPDEPLNHAMQDALKADEYVFRTYVNAAVIGQTPERLKAEFAQLKTAKERDAKLRSYAQDKGHGILSFSFTYYTGKADTVAHIPDVCYAAGGMQPTDSATEAPWRLDRPANQSRLVRTIAFKDETATCHVAYFFQANGKYYSDSLQVRGALTNLFEKYGYYAKVELMSTVKENAVADKAMQDFLSVAMPEIESILPDWDAVVNGKPATQPVADQK